MSKTTRKSKSPSILEKLDLYICMYTCMEFFLSLDFANLGKKGYEYFLNHMFVVL